MPFIETRKPSLALFFAWTVTLVLGVPDLAFPVNSQVPPVAYVAQPFEFTFAATTFTSNSPQISYTIINGPDWLEIDSSNRLFTGTPGEGDAGATTFQLTASDSTGESSSSVTLVVLESTELSLGAPLLPQLQQTGPASAPSSLLLRPLQHLELAFTENTFNGTNPSTDYYAVTQGRSPLPSWVQFNHSSLLFSGTSPPLVSPSAAPQVYGIQLIASNVPGFAEVAISFNIVVGYHVLAFANLSQTVDITSDVPFQTSSLRSSLTLDGNAVSDAQIASVVAQGPDWVELDKGQISLSGTPQSPINTSVIISVTDIYNDTANATVYLQARTPLIVSLGTLAMLNVTAGHDFSFSLDIPPFSSSGQTMADLGNASGWVQFDPANRTLSGHPPLDFPGENITILISFTNATTKATGSVEVHILQSPIATTSAPSKTKGTQATSQTSETDYPSSTSMPMKTVSRRPVVTIILATVLPVLGVLLALCLLLCWRRRRRATSSTTPALGTSGSTLSNGHIATSAIVPVLPVPESEQPTNARNAVPVRPPRIDLTWSNDSLQQSKYRLSGLAATGPRQSLRFVQADRPSLDQDGASKEVHGGMQQMRNLSFVEAGRHPQGTSEFMGSKLKVGGEMQPRHSSTLDLQSIMPAPVGLPDRRNGAGHGAGILGPPDIAAVRRSWRETWGSNPLGENRRTTVVLDSFPNPPSKGSAKERIVSPARSTTPPLRVASRNSGISLSFEERRQKWHTERARARLEGATRFSNAGSSRVMTSSRILPAGRAKLKDPVWSAVSMDDIRNLDDASREHSWSKWSGVGPAAYEPLRAGRASNLNREGVPRPRTTVSIASSRQFDSVTSSDSLWEDENLVVEETKDGDRQWQTEGSSTASPRLPFESFSPSSEHHYQEKGISKPGQARVADRRKHISVERSRLKKSQGSQHGSFRFI